MAATYARLRMQVRFSDAFPPHIVCMFPWPPALQLHSFGIASYRLLEHLQSRGAAASAAQARPDTRQHWRPVPAARQLPWGQQCHAASNAAAAASNVADDQDRTVSGQAPEAALPAQQPAGASHSADGPQPYTARGASSSAASSGTFQGASVEQASGSATAGADASSSDAHQEQQRQQQQGPGEH